MKSTAPIRNLFNPVLKVVQSESQESPQNKTPYLKAILSATPTPVNAERKVNLTTPDLLSALRYIKESALIKR